MIKILAKAYFLQSFIAKLMALVPPVVGHNLGKYVALKKAFYLTSLEGISGDYLEFGVFTGSSLSAAIENSRKPVVPLDKPICYYGFDSFSGFGDLLDQEKDHPFFRDTFFQTDSNSVEKRLSKLLKEKKRLKLIKGFYKDTLHRKEPSTYGIEKAAVILIDCDTFSGASLVFDFIKPILQEGTVLLVDDFFSYKGSSTLGTYGAFLKFQSEQPMWNFRRVFDYGYGGVCFIASK